MAPARAAAARSAAVRAPSKTGASSMAAAARTHGPGVPLEDLHEVTKCASKKSVFFSKTKNRYFCLFFRANLTVLGVLVGSAGE
jgi:hypothetical protein